MSSRGEIHYSNRNITYNESTGQFDLSGIIQFKYKSSYVFKEAESLRVYYTTTPGSAATAEHKDIVPPDSEITGENILKADFWRKPYRADGTNSSVIMRTSHNILGFSPDMHLVRFTIPNIDPHALWYTRAWLRLFRKETSTSPTKPWIHDPVGVDIRYKLQYYALNRPLFCLPVYEQNGTQINIGWEDFTDCIKLPTYDVNSEDVTEDWEDADYKTHRIVTRKKVTGKFEMIFPTMKRYNDFMYYIEQSKQLNGDGIAYVDLQVFVNNMLDIKAGIGTDVMQRINYTGKFFIKIDNNAWVQPIFGHYDKYSPLSITIQEM